MRNFFHGWRRKAGCATLVMACAVMGIWIRSRVLADWFTIRVSELTEHQLISDSSRLTWIRWEYLTANPQDFHETVAVNPLTPHEPRDVKLEWDFAGIRFGRDLRRPGDMPMSFLILPYSTIAIPLSILSGYLILWKPRKRL